jgi:GMP synthase-like glutamine amidotransferase
MILILSTCLHRLSEDEFVKPVGRILDENGIVYEAKHYSEKFDPSQYEAIIICGTALNDFEYMESDLSWIRDYNGKMLGICSGAQMIAVSFEAKLEKKTMIGKSMVNVVKENKLAEGRFESYFLISQIPLINEELISLDMDGYMFRHHKKEIYGLLFHPEVLNRSIIEKFCKISV